MKWVIRKAENRDALAIADIKVNGWRTAYKDIISNEFLIKMSIDEQYEKRKKDIKDGAQIIVYEENKIVKGFAWYGSGRINKNKYDDSIFELYAIYVEPKEKGRGIGTKLLNIAKKEGTKRHYNRMLLWCLRDNIAGRKFYIKNGGRIINIKKTEIGNIDYEEVCFEFDL